MECVNFNKLNHEIDSALILIEQSKAKHDDLAMALYLEAKLTLLLIRDTINQSKTDSEALNVALKKILAERWQRIRGGGFEYVLSPHSPVNYVCILLAHELSPLPKKREDINRLKAYEGPYFLLMPSLKSFKTIAEENIHTYQLHELMISDDGLRFIPIVDTIDYLWASKGAHFFHTSVLVDEELSRHDLSTQDRINLSNHSTAVTKILHEIQKYDERMSHFESRVIQDFDVEIKLPPLGYKLRELSNALKGGGVQYTGQAYDAGLIANRGIVHFFETYWNRIPKSIQDKYFVQFGFLAKPNCSNQLKEIIDRLARPQKSNYQETIYCVELIALKIDGLLKYHQDNIFNSVSFNEKDFREKIEVRIQSLKNEILSPDYSLTLQEITRQKLKPVYQWFASLREKHSDPIGQNFILVNKLYLKAMYQSVQHNDLNLFNFFLNQVLEINGNSADNLLIKQLLLAESADNNSISIFNLVSSLGHSHFLKVIIDATIALKEKDKRDNTLKSMLLKLHSVKGVAYCVKIALRNGHYQVVNDLLSAALKLKKISPDDSTLKDILLAETPGVGQASLFRMAAAAKQYHMMETFVNYTLELKYIDRNDNTLRNVLLAKSYGAGYGSAFQVASENGCSRCVQVLISAALKLLYEYGDIETLKSILISCAPGFGRAYAFKLAVEKGYYQIVDEILKGALIIKNKNDGDDTLKKLLLVEVIGEGPASILALASKYGHHKCVDVLVKNGLELQKLDSDDNTLGELLLGRCGGLGVSSALSIACEKGLDKTVEVLIKGAIELRNYNSNDDTLKKMLLSCDGQLGIAYPLKIACIQNYPLIVKHLISGALFLKDKNTADDTLKKMFLAETPELRWSLIIQYVLKNGQYEVLKELLRGCFTLKELFSEQILQQQILYFYLKGQDPAPVIKKACIDGCLETVEFLVRAAFEMKQIAPDSNLLKQMLLAEEPGLGIAYPLRVACEKGYTNILNVLIQAAIQLKQDEPRDATLKCILSAVDPFDGSTNLLKIAAENNYYDNFHAIIKAGMSLKKTDKSDETLHNIILKDILPKPRVKMRFFSNELKMGLYIKWFVKSCSILEKQFPQDETFITILMTIQSLIPGFSCCQDNTYEVYLKILHDLQDYPRLSIRVLLSCTKQERQMLLENLDKISNSTFKQAVANELADNIENYGETANEFLIVNHKINASLTSTLLTKLQIQSFSDNLTDMRQKVGSKLNSRAMNTLIETLCQLQTKGLNPNLGLKKEDVYVNETYTLAM